MYFCSPNAKKIFVFVSARKILSVAVFPSKRKYFVDFSRERKVIDFVSASKNEFLLAEINLKINFHLRKQNTFPLAWKTITQNKPNFILLIGTTNIWYCSYMSQMGHHNYE